MLKVDPDVRPSDSARKIVQRILDNTPYKNQSRLGLAMGETRAGFSAAICRNRFHDRWLLFLLYEFDFNPKWVKTGTGFKYMRGYNHLPEHREDRT